MFRNYLKITFRNILRHKVCSFINLFGLAVGLTCCLLITLYITNELSYDRHHANADRIYRVIRNFVNQDGSTNLHLGNIAPPFGPLIQHYFPDIEEVVRVLQNNAVVAVNPERTFNEEDIFFAEPAFFRTYFKKTKTIEPD